MKITATVQVEMPREASVGDVMVMTGLARIVAVEEDLVDVQTMGGPPSFLPGDRSYRLLIYRTVLETPA